MGSTPLSIFRVVAQEFDELSDRVVEQWICLSVPMVSKRKFGPLYEQALALLAAHRMKLSGIGADPSEDPLAEVNKIGVNTLMRVGSYSEGSTSIGLNSSLGQLTALDADLGLTTYGSQYLSLRRMRIIPITSAGQAAVKG